jgi:hypothetical protein
MKIKILPFIKPLESIDQIILHNLIKRGEEDLLTASASLSNFNLEIKMQPSFLKYQSCQPASYSFTDGGETINLIIHSYPGQEADRIYNVLKQQLLAIRNNFYE